MQVSLVFSNAVCKRVKTPVAGSLSKSKITFDEFSRLKPPIISSSFNSPESGRVGPDTENEADNGTSNPG